MDVFELHKLSICTFIFDLSKGNLPHDLVEYCQNIQHSYSTGVKKKAYFIYQNVKRCMVNFQFLIWELNCGTPCQKT